MSSSHCPFERNFAWPPGSRCGFTRYAVRVFAHCPLSVQSMCPQIRRQSKRKRGSQKDTRLMDARSSCARVVEGRHESPIMYEQPGILFPARAHAQFVTIFTDVVVRHRTHRRGRGGECGPSLTHNSPTHITSLPVRRAIANAMYGACISRRTVGVSAGHIPPSYHGSLPWFVHMDGVRADR